MVSGESGHFRIISFLWDGDLECVILFQQENIFVHVKDRPVTPLAKTLRLLDKSFSYTLCECSTAFSFACGRFQVVRHTNNSNQRQLLF